MSTYKIDILTPMEAAKFLQSFPCTKAGIRNRAIFSLLFYAQLRCEEALSLRPFDIDYDNGRVVVAQGKGKKRRMAGMNKDRIEEFIVPWTDIRGDRELLFYTNTGRKIDTSYIRKIAKSTAKRMRTSKRIHPHGFRHSGAFELAGRVDLRVLQKQLGHSSLSITDTYVSHIGDKAAADEIANIDF